ncbi:MAG: hypothetical protein KAQ68_01255, partial [Clostridiales bacterium]|nr:hypothetical protein [Clostridiales bacterium]
MRMNNRGAASVLVVLIIVVLATFGGIALTASWTNKNLAIKAAQSKIDYYALDSVAEELIAQIDEQLFLIAQDTTYFMNSLKTDSQGILNSRDMKIEKMISEASSKQKSKAIRTLMLQNMYARIFYYNSAIALDKYTENHSMTMNYSSNYTKAEDFLDVNNSVPSSGDLNIGFSVSMGDKSGQKSLTIIIDIVSPTP